MILYLSIIFIATAIIILLNCLLGGLDYSVWWIIFATILSVVVEIAIQGFFAFIVHLCPNKWFSEDKRFFQVSSKERKFYEKLKIKKWKDNVLELGALGGFRKNHIKDASSPEYLHQFIIECNKGIITHIAGIVFGGLVIFVLPFNYILRITLWVYLVGAFLSLLPILILRYNIPKLQVAYKRALRNKKDDN